MNKALKSKGVAVLENLRNEVCDVAKKAQAEGLCKHRSGNFSALDPETQYVVITPTGVDRECLSARDLLVIDLDANVVENLSNLKPTSETLMHLSIYKTRSEAKAVAHTHSLYATTFALLGKPIPAVVYEAFTLGLTKARIPVAPYARPGTTELAQSVVASCKEAECFLLEKHGAVAFDKSSIEEAYLKISYVEEIAHLYYNALVISHGDEPDSFSQTELSEWEYPSKINLNL